ncbi:hypothetical protein IWZ03DRAFT_377213 [Phyllosticta citriasiana]|uniref:Secreted protein n=1 Tax=Phyllosticta citriasiana TaxID=595635 RepID=A0ABR1KSR4_9PEZI
MTILQAYISTALLRFYLISLSASHHTRASPTADLHRLDPHATTTPVANLVGLQGCLVGRGTGTGPRCRKLTYIP